MSLFWRGTGRPPQLDTLTLGESSMDDPEFDSGPLANIVSGYLTPLNQKDIDEMMDLFLHPTERSDTPRPGL